jgi:hypothetical protein
MRTYVIRKLISVFIGSVVITLAVLPTPASNAVAAEAGPNEGLVIFHRKSSMKGKAIRFNLDQDGIPIGQLLSGTTIERPLPPGNYVFSVRAPSLDGMDVIHINVEAGRTYHVEGKILWGWPAGRPKFGQVSESVAATAPVPAPAQTVTASPPGGALAGPALGSVVAEPGAGAVVDIGRMGLKNFIGDWNLDMWSLATDGSKLEGKGAATGTAEGENATRIMITEFQAAAFPAATGGGQILISYEPEKGFLLVSNFSYSDEVLRFTGRYQADTGKYVYFLLVGSGGQTATGITRSSVKVEIRSMDNASWVAETFASVDGKTTLVQSYRFTRR